MRDRTRSAARRPVLPLLLLLPLMVAACSDGNSPLDPACEVESVTVIGLPELLTAGVPVQLSAQIEGSGCTGAQVAWSGPVQLELDASGTVTGTHLGGPFTVTATVAGVPGSAQTVVAPAPIGVDTRWALAWMHNATAESYDVNMSGYTYARSSAGAIRSVRSGPGRYTVTFVGLAGTASQREAIHLSAYFTVGPRRCRVLSHGDLGADLVVEVRCDTLAGVPADSRFDILVVPAGSMTGRNAFAVSASSDGGVVPAALAHSSASQPIRVTRTETGRYTVVFDDLARAAVPGSGAETFHLTAYGDGNAWCKINDWESVNTTDLALRVRCFTPAGVPADAPFSVLLLEGPRVGVHRLGFLWAHNSSAEVVYAPNSLYSYNSSGALNGAYRVAAGSYETIWNGLARAADAHAETNLVTAYGSNADYCQVYGWGGNATDHLCYAPDGTPVSSQFTAIWIE